MIFLFFLPESGLWQVANKLNALLTSENERLQQLTEDLKQKHSHMTSEVQITLCLKNLSSLNKTNQTFYICWSVLSLIIH